MGSFGYHNVSFMGSESAKRAAAARLEARLDLDELDDKPDPSSDDPFFCGEDFHRVSNATLRALKSIAMDAQDAMDAEAVGLEEVRYHACDGDADSCLAWTWTAKGGARHIPDHGIFTTSFGNALAADRLAGDGEGLPEVAKMLLADRPKREDMLVVAELLGFAILAFNLEPADELPPDAAMALTRATRGLLETADGLLGNWNLHERKRLAARIDEVAAAAEAKALNGIASAGTAGTQRPKI